MSQSRTRETVTIVVSRSVVPLLLDVALLEMLAADGDGVAVGYLATLRRFITRYFAAAQQ